MTTSTKFIRKRQFFLFLPLVLLPFAAFFFWALSGGSNQAIAGDDSTKNLLSTLPGVDLSAQKGFDKMSFYEKADQDSVKLLELQKNDPYYLPRTGERVADYSFGNHHHAQREEEMMYEKLGQLNAALNSPEPSPSPASKSRFREEQDVKIKRLEKMMTDMERPDANDPELQQLNGMLEKILAIQHPGIFAGKEKIVHTGSIYSALPAVIEKNQKISHGSVVQLRLTETAVLNGHQIPKDHLIYGTGEISNQRLRLRIKNIRLGHSLLRVDLTVYDMQDGMEGINVPEALANEAIRDGSGNAVQGMQLLPFEQSLETQIAGAGISAAKGVFNKKVKRIKVKLKDSYPLLLRDNQKKLQ